MKLSEKDVLMLTSLYEMPHWSVFRKVFLEARQLELAQAAPFLPEMDRIFETRGKIVELRHIETEMSKLHESQDKKTKKS